MQKSPNFICANIIKVSSALFSLAVCLISCCSFAAYTVTCNQGEYLPYYSGACRLCDNLDFGRLVCPGGEYSTDANFNHGIYVSVAPVRVCMPGYFLPAGASDCIECSIANITKEIIKLKQSYGKFMERKMVHRENAEDLYISMTVFLSHFEPPSDVDFYLGDVRGLTMTDIDSLYCPGARTVYKDKDVPGGLEVCNKTVKSVGTMNRIICGEEEQDTNTITCEAGYYLPAGENKCVSCVKYLQQPHTYCPGTGPLSVKGEDQGIADCGGHQIVNTARTGCVDITETTEPEFFYGKVNTSSLVGMGKATCDAGQVWDNGKCVSCTSKSEWVNYANENRMYCAGVKNISVIGLQLQDQLTKCPAGMWPTDGLKDCECGYGLTKKIGKCVGSLSYDDMYYGPHGKNAPLFKQCWTKSYDSKAYKKCMGFDN